MLHHIKRAHRCRRNRGEDRSDDNEDIKTREHCKRVIVYEQKVVCLKRPDCMCFCIARCRPLIFAIYPHHSSLRWAGLLICEYLMHGFQSTVSYASAEVIAGHGHPQTLRSSRTGMLAVRPRSPPRLIDAERVSSEL